MLRSAERKAERLLARSDLPASAPPSEIARALGYRIRIDHRLPPDVEGMLDPLTSTIIVARRHAPRQEFTIAHELMEANVPLHLPSEIKEQWCDRGAAALMMPARKFLRSGFACDWDLEVLRAWWPSCSWNALVKRVADLVPGTAAAAWHRAQLRFRQAHPDIALPDHADGLEEFIALEAMHGSGRSEILLGGLQVRAWRSGLGRAVTVVRRLG